jgi:DNA mismatch endonuclease, patch repair protein
MPAMDTLNPAERSARMARIKGRDTKPEMVVRRLVHGLGYRYRLHRADLPGRPDLCFGPARKVIFVHGCFWHRHNAKSCKLTRMPKSRVDFWRTKLEANRARDMHCHRALRALGWQILVVWECELVYREQLKNELLVFLGDRGNESDRTVRGSRRPRPRR